MKYFIINPMMVSVNLFNIDRKIFITSVTKNKVKITHYNNPALTCLNYIFTQLDVSSKTGDEKSITKLFYLVLFH